MSNDFAQRRRIAVAAAITLIAVPGVFLLTRDDTEAVPTVTLVGTVPPTGEAASATIVASPSTIVTRSDGPAATDAMGTTPVAYLEGSAPPVGDDPATIAIPRPTDGVEGTASYKSSIASVSACYVKEAPYNSSVTITNMDNSRSITCIASVGGIEPDEDVLLHADAFVQIADLTDAPVPVEIRW